MSRKNVEDLYSLSPLQQGLLFHTLYAPESGVYVEQLSCTLGGELDRDAFERAWRQTVDRHAILRTAFVWEGLDEPVQVVRRSVRLPFAQEDWRALPAAERDARLCAYLKDDLRRGFDVSKAPLMRIALLQFSADTYQFVWSYHHLMLDGWCIPLVLREVFAFYEAFSRGQSLAPERPRPYRDYIEWLRRQDLTKAESFWRQTLQGFDAPTPLPAVKFFDRTDGELERQEEEYGEQEISLAAETTAALQTLARTHGLTLNTLVQGAWALLLARYSGEQDVVFGVTVAGRPAELAGVESMVGLFINTLPLRVKIDGGQELVSWLKALQQQQTELRQYEYSPLVQVQGWSDAPRGLPLFESLLVFENYPVDASFRQQLAQLSVSNIRKIERTNYPLNLLAVPGAELLLRFSYDRRRFDSRSVARMLGHLQTALENFVARPSQRLAAMPILAPAERRQLLVEWNDTARDYPPHACLHELFEAQVERTPDAVAVVFADERTSYRELNRRANALAGRLRASGVGAETRVGICAERSTEMVVALVGVLKAGGAYVPLEPTYPAERLSYMLSDAQVSVLLTQERLLAALPPQHGAEIICLDRDGKEFDDRSASNVPGVASAHNAAYVIYTSGSTGRPKGVVNTHRGICNRLLWMQDEYELTHDDRVLQKTPFSFDVSVWEFFWPLVTGARLVVARPGGHQDSAYLVRLITRSSITTLHFVPSMLSVFLSEPELEECRSLRRVICSGEALTKELQERFYARLAAAGLHNLYGPTEAAIDVSYWACERGDVRPSVPIGRPIANTQLYVLDGELQPLPVSVAGELYIGGAGLARGYLNRPELTAEKFIANPFGAEPGARLYRTGDVARLLEGGEIEFLGRLDGQVKLRGFRIELGEIESVLAEHQAVGECVVIAREDAPDGDLRIVAYFVPARETLSTPGTPTPNTPTPDALTQDALTPDALRSFLKEKLPEYMLPSEFVALPALPLTPNGKLDRRALPAPQTVLTRGDERDVGARAPLEEVVAGIWAEVLGLDHVGLHEDFFESGGHSLLALRVVSRLRSALKIEVPVRELFDAPTVARFAASIADLQRAELGLPSPSLDAVPRDGDLPPSFAQQRLWFLDQLEPGSAAYNIPAAIRLTGKLDARALEESFNEILRRHEVLRTSFATVGGQPVQRIAPVLRLALPVEDVRGAVGDGREAVVNSIVAGEAGRAFDLEAAPLLRLRLLRVGLDEHVLVLVMHHIISDGWSIGILIREVAALYEAFSNGRPSPLKEPCVQYADYAVWQREWLQGEVLAKQLAYWKGQLDGSPPRLQLHAMREQPARREEPHAFGGAKQEFVFPCELSESLKRLSRREGATLFMTLLAAFQTLLHRYTGEADITTGSPVANRNHERVEGLIGFFVNTLVLRTDLAGNPTFTKLLRRVREATLGAYAHQDVPFEKLVEELQPERDLSHAPLFQVMFVLQNAPMPALELPGLALEPLPVAGDGAKFDLTLSLEETGDGLKGLLEYNRNIFDEAAIGRLVSHFRNLLEAVADDPAQRLSELRLLGEDERRQLLVEWNDTGVGHERDRCLHELFERQVERTPEVPAVSFVGEDGHVSVLSYRELNARANCLARHLARLGVGAEDVVGILAARAPETVVGVLGVLKAGGAYLPLDPAYPRERLDYMLSDARACVLLTERQHAESLHAHDAEVIYLDAAAGEAWARESAENLPRRAAAENLAYVIYTSGSTGKPKGVMVSHRGLSNLSLAEALALELKAESRVLQFASWSFDASVFETAMTLMCGATLCFAPAGADLPGEAFTRFLREHSVNTIALTPTTLAAVPAAELPDLQTVITGGEPCPPELVARWANGRRFFNVYGPTETTTWATFARCAGDGRTPSIGRPIANTQVYILDGRLQPVPIGVVGQLHIGGVALARGYLNRPELTAEKFIPDPFGVEPGARLYRTGDTARYRVGGEIEFVGRIDRQVKLRGFRIELGEIESALASHAAVRECAVVVREDAREGDRRIVAYATLDNGASAPHVAEWRSFLKGKLPDYMIPAAFVVLEAMPLTPGGKLDHRALPAPEQGISDAGEALLSPARTPTEEVLAGIWAEVLGLERVGLAENFFESGGHSLLATQLVSRVREVFKVELPLRDFFDAPTVCEVAAKVESLLRAEQGLQLTPITHAPRDRELPLSFAQQRLWFLEQFEPGNSFYNVPGAVRLTGALNVAALEQGLNEVVRRHEILRTSFESTHGQPRQVIAPALKLSLAHENLQDLNEHERREEVRRLAVEEAERPFDLSRAPLVRARLLQVADDEHVLLFTMHHIVSDGWSVNVLLAEVAALYDAHMRGEPSPLAELSIQYADFAAWQREWLDGAQLDTQLGYWREQLRDAPALLELPTDHARPPVQTYRGATARFTLPKNLSLGLQRLSRREGATLFMTLLAAFQSLLQRYSGAEDVVVGTPIAGRTRAEIEKLIGFFVNTLVLRTTFGGDPSFVELLARVREVCLGAYAHQDVPFEKLVEELQPERELSHAPLFQVMFSLQNASAEGAQLQGLELSSLEVESGVAKFDLTLAMHETREGLAGLIEYNTDLFEAETIERMIGHLTTLLEGIAADPERRVAELPLMTEGERRRVVREWNETGREYARGVCVHEMFERQALARPEAVAIVCDGKEWTFAEVNARANKLARYLRKCGVGAEDVVGVLMERSAETFIGLLGVLKAGGAYLPLDPAYPEERLAFILQDARVALLLTEERLRRTTFEPAARVVCADAEQEAFEREGVENLARAVSADNLVYVIYTSGSTGRPKGVAVPHGALANHARAMGEHYDLQPEDRVLQFASISFDVAAEELFASWARGATVVLMPPDDYLLQTFLKVVEEQRVSVVNLSATYWYEWVAALSRREAVLPPRLRLVVTGSEKVATAQLATWQELAGERVRWINAYGPTEATITTTVFEPRGELKYRGVGSVPIGRPVNNARVYLLDKKLQSVPVGIAGELYIGGSGVARGYLNRAELTAEKFIPDPFSAEAGARLYRSGDWARYLPDGQIEFLRRIDEQVKVRGFRIELGEIEAAIAGHAGVHETVVVMRGDASEDKRIVAYVVPKRADAGVVAGSITAEKLRAYLAERVPGYMLPSAFVLLAEMPLTPSGKIDVRALPAPETPSAETDASFAQPRRSPFEEVLAGIFCEVLKLERVGVDDNFFALGGHSLLAAQVVARAREVFRLELPLRALFESPTVSGLAAHVEALDETAAHRATAPPLRPVPRDGELPLSFIQQRFWFLHQLMPESSAYNIPTAVRLAGALDVAALERSFNEVVRRHEILRTGFVSVGGRPEQLIADELKLSLPLIDLGALATQEREAEARRLAAEEAQKPFDLARAPLLRAALLRLDAQEFVLLFTMHHIVSDGWSAGVLIRDLTAIYEAYAAGLPSPLPPLPIQFADFAHWQREWLQGEVLENRLSYWRRQLGSGLPVLNLPTDRPRPPVPTDHGAIQTLVLPATLGAAIGSLGQRESVTLFMLLLAAFKVLLHRYTGQEDILVGSSIANRNHVETEGLIGLLINTLVLRTDLSGDPAFRELLARVREASLGAYAHQDLPFEQLLEELRADLDAATGNAPVFQVAFQLQNFSIPSLELRDLTLSPFDVEGRTAKFDLSLSVIETQGGLAASLEYNTDLFEAATIKRLLGHYRTLLEGVVADPSRRISALPLLNDAERQQLLSEWNPAFESEAPAACLQHLFEAQARRRPDGIALVFEERRLTYGELNRRANQLAHYLKRRGVCADTLVAVCVERSVEMLVGILGILKAGGAYVPLDPAYPKERLAFILKDTQARLLLTQQSLVESLPQHDSSVVLLDAGWQEIAGAWSDENPAVAADASSLAYVIYTSGSTGRPKGVLVTHENVARLLEAAQAHFEFDESDVWTLFHSYAFDFSVWEIWGALAHGGRLVVVPYWISRSAEAFHSLLASEQVTVLNQTPSAFRQLAAADEAAGGSEVELKLRLVIFGGEALEPQSLRSWFARRGERTPQLVNMFGITETTVHVTYRALTLGDLELAAGSRIGRPLECLQVYLLDGRGQPVPVGVPAEICVGGTGVARGYLNHAELTAERFVPHPFARVPGARLYRSGDLARRMPDGDIEYLGRIDNQVKVRGHRIELGEIESALAEHEGVRECTVIASNDANGETKLLAYLVGRRQQQPAPSVTELREFLQEKLPEHMIPAAFVVLDAMPLTPNGKIDRRALPAPGQSRPQLGREFVAPRTPVERELAAIWRELLGVEEVGIYDDFFELGGHSLLLTQLASWIRKDFQVEVPLRVLFDTPTITDMTKAILARQVERETQTDLAEMLTQLKQLSPHEVKAMLEKMGGTS